MNFPRLSMMFGSKTLLKSNQTPRPNFQWTGNTEKGGNIRTNPDVGHSRQLTGLFKKKKKAIKYFLEEVQKSEYGSDIIKYCGIVTNFIRWDNDVMVI